MADPSNYQKYADGAVRERAFEEGLGRLRMGMFVAILGPLALGVVWLLGVAAREITWLRYAILATAPLGALLGIINYFRVPGAGKLSGRAIFLLILTLVFAAVTVTLGRSALFQLF